MSSIAFLAWCLVHDPSAQILSVSYAQDLADKLARDCRIIMMSPWYRRIFPTRLAPHRQAVQEFITTDQGYRIACSNGGALTGRGADIIIIDDPLKPEEALSQAQRTATNDWYDHTLYSRQNDKQRGAIVITMQRLQEDDLIGHVLAQEQWEVLSFPAIAEADEEHRLETICGVREQQALFAATELLIEDKASGTQLIQELIVEGCHGVTRYEPTTEKIMRLHAQTAMIENGFVRIPETAPWLAEYLHEMTVFPKGKHDDQVDSTAQFLDWFRRPFPGQGIFEYYRRLAHEAEERNKPQPAQTTWAIGSMEWQAEMNKSS